MKNSNAFNIFSCQTSLRQFAIHFQGPKMSYSLYSEIWSAANISLFKSKLRDALRFALVLSLCLFTSVCVRS